MKFLVVFLLSLIYVLPFSQFLPAGLLQTAKDFDRIQETLDAKNKPWITAWSRFIGNDYSSPDYTPNPASIIYRGSDGVHAQNYPQLYQDIAASSALAIRWSITKNDTFGEAAICMIDAWSSNLMNSPRQKRSCVTVLAGLMRASTDSRTWRSTFLICRHHMV